MPDAMPDLNRGALAPVSDEVDCERLDVTGEIPESLRGRLLRNGPNPFDGRFPEGDMLQWWAGSAMLHGISFGEGRATSYRNRWVRTGPWRRRFQDAQLPPDPLWDQNPNVSVVQHAGRLLALGEGGVPFEVSSDLETQRPFPATKNPLGMTAHPKVDPESGELIFFRADWQAPYLTYGVLDAAGNLVTATEIEIPAATMMHDFAITENYSLLLDVGVGYDFSLLSKGARMPLRWDEDRPSRIGVVPRHGGTPRWFEIEPCFLQHVANAYEASDDTIVFEAVRYPTFLCFDEKAGAFLPNPLGTLWRYSLRLGDGTVRECPVTEPYLELPRIDDRRCGRDYRYVYAVEQPSDQEMRGVLRYDRQTEKVARHSLPLGDQNSEPVFVPRSSTSAEGDGWLLVCAYRSETDCTDVLVLDAQHPEDDPVATVHLPRRIPAGFHGAWIPSGMSE